MPNGRHLSLVRCGEFGEPDAYGIVGESPAAWRLREELAFVAKSTTHALLAGASGTGKELAARAIHAMSSRASRPFVARNAATLPAGLVDAELFGNARNYPNAGMSERPGIIGQADGGTLFLDEIGELPLELQSHLLRVLDAGGEYQRLGDAMPRRSDFRLVAATNRDPSLLKHDLLARLVSRVELSPLSARREDIPLLARHLALDAAKRSPEVAATFIDHDAQGRSYARFAPGLIEYALHQELATNTRQLEGAIWKAMREARGREIDAPSEWQRTSTPPSGATRATRPSSEPSAERIRAALQTSGGRVVRAARALGLSRFALHRLMKKNGIPKPTAD
jgi:DNA-binding NtrC family response regulator